jgi:hypothetical protein
MFPAFLLKILFRVINNKVLLPIENQVVIPANYSNCIAKFTYSFLSAHQTNFSQ